MVGKTDVQRLRAGLESALSPAVATAVLFDALDRWDRGIPADEAELRDLLHGPLSAILEERFGADRRDGLIAEVEARLDPLARAEGPTDTTEDDALELEIDLDESEDDVDDGARTAQMMAVPHPVSVLVVGRAEAFGERVLAAVGRERARVHTADDERSLRHATFSANPLIVVVDASAPPDIRPPELATALRGLPDATLAVVWAEDTEYGRETRLRVEHAGADVLFLPRTEGIDPLLDLILSRFARAGTIPPPAT